MFTPEEEKKGKSTGFEWSTAGPPMTPHKRERESFKDSYRQLKTDDSLL